MMYKKSSIRSSIVGVLMTKVIQSSFFWILFIKSLCVYISFYGRNLLHPIIGQPSSFFHCGGCQFNIYFNMLILFQLPSTYFLYYYSLYLHSSSYIQRFFSDSPTSYMTITFTIQKIKINYQIISLSSSRTFQISGVFVAIRKFLIKISFRLIDWHVIKIKKRTNTRGVIIQSYSTQF